MKSTHMNRRRFAGSAMGAAALLAIGRDHTLAQNEEGDQKEELRGGLGMTGEEWIELWGEPDAEVKGKYWKFEYKRFGMVIKLPYLEDDQHIIMFDAMPVFPNDAASIFPNVERFIPEDAEYIEDYPRPFGPGAVSRFNSAWLAQQFESIEDSVIDDWFPGGDPGDFILIYQEDESGRVENVLVGLGNNP